MTTTSEIHDIAWTDMREAGINVRQVRMIPTDHGTHEYLAIGGDGLCVVAFGPAVDFEAGGGTRGWTVTVRRYVSLRTDSAVTEDLTWLETPAEVLPFVAKELAL